MMKKNLRGELTLYKNEKMQQFSLRDNELIDAVASHFKVGSTEVSKVYLTSDSVISLLPRLFFLPVFFLMVFPNDFTGFRKLL